MLVWPSSLCPSVFCVKNFYARLYTQTFQRSYRRNWPLPFSTSLSGHDLGRGSQCQWKTMCGKHFLADFSTAQVKFGCAVEAIQVGPFDLTLEWYSYYQRKWLLFYWLHENTLRFVCIQMFVNWFGSDRYRTLHVDTSLNDLYLDSRPQRYEKLKV